MGSREQNRRSGRKLGERMGTGGLDRGEERDGNEALFSLTSSVCLCVFVCDVCPGLKRRGETVLHGVPSLQFPLPLS